MSQSVKSAYYKALKGAGVEFEKHYREYSTDEFKTAFDKLVESGVEIQLEEEEQAPPPVSYAEPEPEPGHIPLAPLPEPGARTQAPRQDPSTSRQAAPAIPMAERPASVMPGERALAERVPLRQDEQGLIWYQEEVPKPAFPKPRGRRVLRYLETGVKTQTVKSGEYTETFEVAGDSRTIESQVKITLPSYQVGIYKDPRFDFLIHIYNEQRGFDYFDINNYYGGSELVPDDIKKIYVQNVLCYDIRTVIRSITTEARRLQLAGKI